MAINSIMICDINPEYTAEYIANILETREIARVKSVTLIPDIKNDDICNIAYIDINSYCDTEAAYKFINNIKYGGCYILYHDFDENAWIIQKNTHNSGDLDIGTFTTKFYDNQYQEEVPSEELPFEELPIHMDYYSLDQEEINNCENELRLQEAVNNSYYVTVRPHQQYFDNRKGIWSLINHAVNNSHNVTLRPHQQDFKLLRCELERSLSDLPV